MRKSLLAVMTLAVFAAPVYADVIPSRPSTGSADVARVTDRLASLGVDSAKAHEMVKGLADSELTYFAADTGSLQVVGERNPLGGEADTFWYETLLGAVMLGGTVGAVYVRATNK